MPRKRNKYIISLDDEAHLVNIGRWPLTPGRFAGGVILFLFLSIIFGFLLFYFTPIKRILPGYLKHDERASTEQTMMRLDSLQNAFNQNEAFLNNIMTVLNTERIPSDSAAALRRPNFMTPDSLKSASPAEKKFISAMQEKQRFNISVVAPLAAESMLFFPLNDKAVISNDSRSLPSAKVFVPAGSTVSSIADGTVISVEFNHGKNVVVIQHSKGFLSRYQGVGTPLVDPGDQVTGGQGIAFSPSYSKKNPPAVILQMWHNGNQLIPYEYISPHSSPSTLLTTDSSEL